MMIAVIASSTWAAIAGYLKVYKGIHEVISTIMLNYIGTGLIAYSLSTIFLMKMKKMQYLKPLNFLKVKASIFK